MDDNGLLMDERHRICQDTDWVISMRTRFNRPNLFVYFHTEHQTYVLAEWLVQRDATHPGMCVELLAQEEHPQQCPPDNEWMRARLRPEAEQLTAFRDARMQHKVDRQLLRDESEHDRHEAARFLRRGGRTWKRPRTRSPSPRHPSSANGREANGLPS
jgi:hypothetical protein